MLTIMNKMNLPESVSSSTVLVWNTLKMVKIINQLRADSEQLENEGLAHISPHFIQPRYPARTYKIRDNDDNTLNMPE